MPLFVSSAYAMDFRTGDLVVITDTVYEDLYLFSGSATINADVIGDVYVFGGTVSINGNISQDVVVMGGTVNMTGSVGDDVRIIGGDVTVYSQIQGDLLMAGGSLDIAPDSIVNGSAQIAGGIISLDGKIMQDLEGNVGVLRLNGQVYGNVNVTIENIISFSDKSLVYGNFTYRQLMESSIPKGVVKGKIEYKEFSNTTDISFDKDYFVMLFLAFKTFSLLNALLLVLLFVILTPKLIEKSAEIAKKNLMKTFSVGLLSLILFLVGSIIAVMTVVGIHFALIAGFIFAAMIYLAKIFAAGLLSSYIIDFRKKKHLRLKLFFAMSLVMLIYYLIGMTPIIGWFLNMILFVMGLGSIILVKQYYFLYLRNKNQI